MRSLIFLTVTGLTLSSACAEPATRSDKDQILAWAKSYFADPYALRSTEISDRAVVNGVSVLCVGFNGKNGYGAYVGIYRKPFEITPVGLKIVETNYKFDTSTCWHPSIKMSPFPELSQIR